MPVKAKESAFPRKAGAITAEAFLISIANWPTKTGTRPEGARALGGIGVSEASLRAKGTAQTTRKCLPRKMGAIAAEVLLISTAFGWRGQHSEECDTRAGRDLRIGSRAEGHRRAELDGATDKKAGLLHSRRAGFHTTLSGLNGVAVRPRPLDQKMILAASWTSRRPDLVAGMYDVEDTSAA